MFKRLVSSIVCICFIFSNFQLVHAQEFSLNQLPVPGTMVGMSDPFTPLTLKGLVINPQKPLEFQFIVDTGKGSQDTASIKQEANSLVKYFLAGLTIPEGDLWVNLSPYEKDRITTSSMGQTELGRDLLAQDYILKQLTASLIYPEKDLGKEFWSRVYKQAQEKFGTTDIPVNTFNKVWILPDQAQVFENGSAAYVTKSTLKVMLDEDYVAFNKNTNSNQIGSQIVRDIVIPEITKEVNAGKNFAPLRQIYEALILAKWYKETIANGLLDALYTNKSKVAGVSLSDPTVKQQIYDRYLQAYKKGVFNYIKEDLTPNGSTPRKYFSGGLTLMKIPLAKNGMQADVKGDGAMVALQVKLDSAMTSQPEKTSVDNSVKADNKLTSQEVQALTPQFNSAKEFFDQIKEWEAKNPNAKLLVLVRHGESGSNLFRFSQSYDAYSPLTLRGLKQRLQMAQFFLSRGIDFDRYISSDLERANETLNPLAEGNSKDIEVLKRFREVLTYPMGMGGVPHKIVHTLMPDVFSDFMKDPLSFGVSSSVSVSKMKKYMAKTFDEIKDRDEKRTIIATHGMTMVLAVLELLGIPYNKYQPAFSDHLKDTPNLGLTVLAWDPQQQKWNFLVKPDNTYLSKDLQGRTTSKIDYAKDWLRFYGVAAWRTFQGKFGTRKKDISDWYPNQWTFSTPSTEELAKIAGQSDEPEDAAMVSQIPKWPTRIPSKNKEFNKMVRRYVLLLNESLKILSRSKKNEKDVVSEKEITAFFDAVEEFSKSLGIKDAVDKAKEDVIKKSGAVRDWKLIDFLDCSYEIFFIMNQLKLVENGWLFGLARSSDHKYFIRTAEVKEFDVLEYEGEKVLMVSVQEHPVLDEMALGGVFAKAKAISTRRYLIFNADRFSASDILADRKETQSFLTKETIRRMYPNMVSIREKENEVSDEDYIKIIKDDVVLEEWLHYIDKQLLKKAKDANSGLTLTDQVGIILSQEPKNQVVDAIKVGLENVANVWDNSDTDFLIRLALEMRAYLHTLFFAKTKNHVLVTLARISEQTDPMQRTYIPHTLATRVLFYTLDKFLEGSLQPTVDFMKPSGNVLDYPVLARLEPNEIWKKIKEIRGEIPSTIDGAMVGQVKTFNNWETLLEEDEAKRMLMLHEKGTTFTTQYDLLQAQLATTEDGSSALVLQIKEKETGNFLGTKTSFSILRVYSSAKHHNQMNLQNQPWYVEPDHFRLIRTENPEMPFILATTLNYSFRGQSFTSLRLTNAFNGSIVPVHDQAFQVFDGTWKMNDFELQKNSDHSIQMVLRTEKILTKSQTQPKFYSMDQIKIPFNQIQGLKALIRWGVISNDRESEHLLTATVIANDQEAFKGILKTALKEARKIQSPYERAQRLAPLLVMAQKMKARQANRILKDIEDAMSEFTPGDVSQGYDGRILMYLADFYAIKGDKQKYEDLKENALSYWTLGPQIPYYHKDEGIGMDMLAVLLEASSYMHDDEFYNKVMHLMYNIAHRTKFLLHVPIAATTFRMADEDTFSRFNLDVQSGSLTAQAFVYANSILSDDIKQVFQNYGEAIESSIEIPTIHLRSGLLPKVLEKLKDKETSPVDILMTETQIVEKFGPLTALNIRTVLNRAGISLKEQSKEIPSDWLENVSIADLNLGQHIETALKSGGIENLFQLIGRPKENILAITGIENEHLKRQIEPILKELGLSLKADAAMTIGGAQTVVVKKLNKTLTIPSEYLTKLSGRMKVAKKLGVELHTDLYVKDDVVVGMSPSISDETRMALVTPVSRDEKIVTETGTYFEDTFPVLRKIKELAHQIVLLQQQSGQEVELVKVKEDLQRRLDNYLRMRDKVTIEKMATVSVYSVKNKKRYDLVQGAQPSLEDFVQDMEWMQSMVNTWNGERMFSPEESIVDYDDIVGIHNHPDDNPAPPSAIDPNNGIGDIYQPDFFGDKISGLILPTSKGDELFFFYEPDGSQKGEYERLYNLYWYKNGDPKIDTTPSNAWDHQRRTYTRSINEQKVLEGLRGLAMNSGTGSVLLDAAMTVDQRTVDLKRANALMKEIATAMKQLDPYFSDLRLDSIQVGGIKRFIKNPISFLNNAFEKGVGKRFDAKTLQVVKKQFEAARERLHRFSDYDNQDGLLEWVREQERIDITPGMRPAVNVAEFVEEGNFIEDFASQIQSVREVFDAHYDELLTIMSRLSEQEAIVAAEKEGVSTNGKMALRNEDLVNLGLKYGAKSYYGGGWNIEQIFPRFKEANKKVRAILIDRLSQPSRSKTEIEKMRRPIKEILDIFEAEKQSGSQESKKRLLAVSKNISEFFITAYDRPHAKREHGGFYEELEKLKDNHYFNKYYGGTFEHGAPYHETTWVLIRLAQMINTLQEIQQSLPKNSTGRMGQLREKIAEILADPRMASLVERKSFLKAALEKNPYVFIAPKRIKSVKALYDEDWTHESAQGLQEEWESEGKLNDILREFSELVDSTTGLLNNFWEINVADVKEKDKVHTKKSGGLSDRHPFLRQFPDRMSNLLAEVDFYIRAALTGFEGGYAFADASSKHGVINVSSLYNPLIEGKAETDHTAPSIINKSRGDDIFNLGAELETDDGVEQVEMRKTRIRPITIKLSDNQNALLISGPNMGGKTETARALVFAVLLNQAGLPVPAEFAELSVFKNIYSVFPKLEQLKDGHGYYGNLLEELTKLTQKVGEGDLIILDEVPIGTDYYELVAVTTVLIEDLIKKGATVIVTGHLKKAFELIVNRTGVTPYMHTVDKDGKPDYGITPGIAKRSYGIELTREAEFPSEVTDLAKSYYEAIMDGRGLQDLPSLEQKIDSQVNVDPEADIPRMAQDLLSKMWGDFFVIKKTKQRVINTALSTTQTEKWEEEGWESFLKKGLGYKKETIEAETTKEKKEDVHKEERVPFVKSAQERLRVTDLFITKGEKLSKELHKTLLGLGELQEITAYSWSNPGYDHKKAIINFGKLQKFLEKILEQTNGMEQDPYMAKVISAIQTMIKEIGDAHEDFEDSNGKGIDQIESFEELEKKIGELKAGDFHDFVEDFQKRKEALSKGKAKFLDERASRMLYEVWKKRFEELFQKALDVVVPVDEFSGITQAIYAYQLKKPTYVQAKNIFKMTSARPFYTGGNYDDVFSRIRGALTGGELFIKDGKLQELKIDPQRPVFVLTGPNSSGKSLLMLSVYVNARLARNGLYTPSDLEIGEFDNIFGFFGGENSIGEGKSYFMDVLERYAKMLKNVTPNSFVILDELHGTDNFELAAIQLAVLHYLRSKGVTVVFNTHIRDGLKLLADKLGLDLWQTDVDFDEATNKIIAKYSISPDPELKAKSYGLIIARQWLNEDQWTRANAVYNELTGTKSDAAMAAPTVPATNLSLAAREFVDEFPDSFEVQNVERKARELSVKDWKAGPLLQILTTTSGRYSRARQGVLMILRLRKNLVEKPALWPLLEQHAYIDNINDRRIPGVEQNNYVRVESLKTMAVVDLEKAIPYLIDSLIPRNERATVVRNKVIEIVAENLQVIKKLDSERKMRQQLENSFQRDSQIDKQRVLELMKQWDSLSTSTSDEAMMVVSPQWQEFYNRNKVQLNEPIIKEWQEILFTQKRAREFQLWAEDILRSAKDSDQTVDFEKITVLAPLFNVIDYEMAKKLEIAPGSLGDSKQTKLIVRAADIYRDKERMYKMLKEIITIIKKTDPKDFEKTLKGFLVKDLEKEALYNDGFHIMRGLKLIVASSIVTGIGSYGSVVSNWWGVPLGELATMLVFAPEIILDLPVPPQKRSLAWSALLAGMFFFPMINPEHFSFLSQPYLHNIAWGAFIGSLLYHREILGVRAMSYRNRIGTAVGEAMSNNTVFEELNRFGVRSFDQITSQDIERLSEDVKLVFLLNRIKVNDWNLSTLLGALHFASKNSPIAIMNYLSEQKNLTFERDPLWQGPGVNHIVQGGQYPANFTIVPSQDDQVNITLQVQSHLDDFNTPIFKDYSIKLKMSEVGHRTIEELYGLFKKHVFMRIILSQQDDSIQEFNVNEIVELMQPLEVFSSHPEKIVQEVREIMDSLPGWRRLGRPDVWVKISRDLSPEAEEHLLRFVFGGKTADHDQAMTGNRQLQETNPGGIDLNQINVKRTGKTIAVQFDPAQLNELLQGGFEGFTPVIINITPIQSPLPLLGLAPRREEESLAKI